MKKRKLGKNGPEVSAIGIGAMSFAGFYGSTTLEEAFALLDASRELGVDHLDTSNVYGNGKSEQMIGAYLADRGAAARGAFKIATKAGINRDPDTGRRWYDNSFEHLQSELDGSLKRLGVDAVDLFYVHRRQADKPIEEVAEALGRLVKAGKTKSIGFSEIAPSSLRRANAVFPVAAVQNEYSLSTRFPELGLVQASEELGTALVAFSPVGRGLLTDTPPSAAKVEDVAFLQNNPRFMAPNLSANLKLTEGFRALAAEMGLPAAGLAIAWLLAKSPAVIPIPGTRNAAHMKELAAGASRVLTEEEISRIERVLPVGWAHGDRYSDAQWIGPERYC